MNQVHKVIWSRVKNCYIVVSEITKRVGRDNKASVTGIRPLRALLCAMVIAGCMLPADADAASGIVWGTGASAPGQDSVAVGTNAKAKKSHAVAQGTEAKADGVYALAFGYKVQIRAAGSQSGMMRQPKISIRLLSVPALSAKVRRQWLSAVMHVQLLITVWPSVTKLGHNLRTALRWGIMPAPVLMKIMCL